VDGVLPISLSLTDNSARIVGAYVRSGLVDVVRPPLDRIEAHLLELNNGLRMLSIDVVDVFNGITDRRLKVQVMNESLLDHIEATRWAVAYFSYNTFLELLDHIRYMRWLDGRSHLHLHQIIEGLTRIESLVAAFATEVSGMGSIIIGLLQAILDKLNQGIGLTGTIQIIVTGADPLAEIDLWKLLGLLGLLFLGLAIIVAFLFGVSAALATFGAGALKAAAAVVVLSLGLIPLINALAKFELGEMLMIAAGFLAITLFVAGLGRAFQEFKTDLEKVIPPLNTFFDSIAKLMTTLSKFKPGEMATIAVGFAAIAGFVAGLGLAFQQVTSDLEKVIPPLNTFFDSIAKLMTTLSKFKPGEMATIAVGFAAIAGFVALLGLAFQQVTSDLEKIVPQLDTFFTSISNLMTAISRFTPGQMVTIAVGFLLIAGFVWLLGMALDTLSQKAISALEPLAAFFTAITALMIAISKFTPGEMFQIAVGFIMIAGFVWLLSMAINTLTAQSVAALPGLAALITALTGLASTLGNMTAGQMFTMAIGLILIAAFVWAIAAALVYAAGPLATLATLFGSLGGVLSTVADIGSGLWGVLSDIGGVIGDIGGGIGDFFGGVGDTLFGSLDVTAMVNQTALAAAAPPPPPPVAAAPAGLPGGLGALAPGGALAAAPVGSATTVDQTVNAGGISVSISADRLEADSAQLLTDDIVAQLQSRLGALRSTQDFQAGARPAVT
jgi:hypothetical protein